MLACLPPCSSCLRRRQPAVVVGGRQIRLLPRPSSLRRRQPAVVVGGHQICLLPRPCSLRRRQPAVVVGSRQFRLLPCPPASGKVVWWGRLAACNVVGGLRRRLLPVPRSTFPLAAWPELVSSVATDNAADFADVCSIFFSSCLPGGWKHFELCHDQLSPNLHV
ncbi:Os11g0661900 [Oryza sativa Japonica Group]|jgi:hypothetical protein|uniref:Os11g0661900 protein n=2 Tax=Oryza sativa subsp. japonica TaxID=39947 RepID=Q0IR89_ORYSJ|nr:Os11g0661900 [Oryza sativa Japonica Group]BAT15147.1 Os11g0661900 [Oryza sativa Japonica Group]|eukprot:NP_001068413.1 Os11g0661900 [Oryza sativa Japonica Group]